MASLTAFPKPKPFKTAAIPKAKPVKLSAPKPVKLPKMTLPTMKTGGTKLPKIGVAAVHGYARTAMPSMGPSALAKAASSSGSGAGAVMPGKVGWRNQGRTLRPQQASPMGFFNQ